MADQPRHPREGNVIYANFGRKSAHSGPEKKHTASAAGESGAPRRASSQQRGIAEFLRAAVSSRADSGRLHRGRDYALNGNVVNLEIANGRVDAQVAGSQLQPFSVTIILPYRSPDDLAEVGQILLSTKDGFENAKAGRVDPRVREIILGSEPGELRFICDCPDHSDVCKHAVAVVEILIRRLEADPKELFRLRGLDINQLASMVTDHATARSAEAGSSTGPDYWEGGTLPELPEPKVRSALDDSNMDLLHQAMRMVSYTTIDQLAAVADIEDLYDFLIEGPPPPETFHDGES
ncbi:hypothetical protein L1O03_07000 [Corynebacterium uropygiale]|uniref:SWIM-type domain-containing protein n=1 Tax=Corynebacterium uropygiale TaxID=1775911 RepID=A0A9X1QRN3_9CORY|nr:hypothetical protein [Corynebacterium uropygiale]MCF4006925.1 hypothetical protein [Corynebacterium uropygiale]